MILNLQIFYFGKDSKLHRNHPVSVPMCVPGVFQACPTIKRLKYNGQSTWRVSKS